MTDFNQKTHDTDVGSHGGQSRQMMEVFENQEFGSIRLLQEAGKTFFCASDVAKALGHAAPVFSLAGTAVKASGTDAQPDAAGSVLWGLGSFPNKQKIAFVSRKPCLQKSGF